MGGSRTDHLQQSKPRPDTDKLSTAALSSAITILKADCACLQTSAIARLLAKYSPRLSTFTGRFQLSHPLAGINYKRNFRVLTRIHSPIPGGYVFQQTGL
ncbi:hypothetical protein DPMN_167357 [Dreissena polymorpha]|uniref:Uncharacterized protein n=1 Tax=Dreissena polymorpha TaxID=45954 RepID=A0A9D4IY99_DREPO|nr:hypothetical protein DPMN_167357 [Dreissena polymorpha]